MKKPSVLFSAFILLVVQCFSQEIEWQNTLASNGYEDLRCVVATTDGGCVLGGSSMWGGGPEKTSLIYGGFDYWIVKLDVSGNIQWEKSYGGGYDDKLFALDQTSDGGYIFG